MNEFKSAEHYLKIANVHKHNSEFAEAIEVCHMALQHDSQCPGVHKCLADCYRQVARFDLASDHYVQELKINPQSPGVYYLLGQTYDLMGAFYKALDCYAEALKINPSDALVRQARKETSEILRMIQKVRSENSGVFDRVNLAGLLMAKNVFAMAIEHLQKAAASAPKDIEILAMLAQAMMAADRYQEAIDVLKHILMINPLLDEYSEWLATAYYSLRDYAQAIATWKQMLKHFDSENPQDQLRIQAITARIELAQKTLEQSL